tara:strand:+ start:333 stop:503 length:171 start_codon:yes stop_codon:yes gene_type:complete
MTEPVELLEQRINEIRAMLVKAKKNQLSGKEVKDLQHLHDRYYVCIQSIKKKIKIL